MTDKPPFLTPVDRSKLPARLESTDLAAWLDSLFAEPQGPPADVIMGDDSEEDEIF